MLRLSAFVSLLLLTLSQFSVRASPCLTFDAGFNLLAFGLSGKDWNAGTQDGWTTGQSSFSVPRLCQISHLTVQPLMRPTSLPLVVRQYFYSHLALHQGHAN